MSSNEQSERPHLSEADLRRGYGNRHVAEASWMRIERARPGLRPIAGYHQCLDCVLALIPDEKAAVLCQFCLRTRALARGKVAI